LIASGDVLIAIKTHHDGVQAMLVQKQWQQPVDPVSANFKEFVEREPEHETPEARQERLAVLAAIERGEAMHSQEREYLTFSGYLANRIPRKWGRWSRPWPAIFWGAEILVGSTVGAWLSLWTLRAASPQPVSGRPPSNPQQSIQGGRG
jgi:hypothetical protein